MMRSISIWFINFYEYGKKEERKWQKRERELEMNICEWWKCLSYFRVWWELDEINNGPLYLMRYEKSLWHMIKMLWSFHFHLYFFFLKKRKFNLFVNCACLQEIKKKKKIEKRSGPCLAGWCHKETNIGP